MKQQIGMFPIARTRNILHTYKGIHPNVEKKQATYIGTDTTSLPGKTLPALIDQRGNNYMKMNNYPKDLTDGQSVKAARRPGIQGIDQKIGSRKNLGMDILPKKEL